MSPTKPELQLSAAMNLAAIETHAGRLKADMLALYALDQPDPPPVEPDPPIVVDPPKPPVFDPPIVSSAYGCQVPAADRVEWVFAPVKGAGRPPGVPAFASGNTMERFTFRPPADGYTEKGIFSGAEKGVVGVTVRDSVIAGYRPWGGNTKGVYSASFYRNTTVGQYGTGQHIEHGRYLGVEGPSPEVLDEYTASLVPMPTRIVEDLGLSGVMARAAICMDGELFDRNPGGGYQEVNRDFHKGATEARNPATFDADAGATWIHATKFTSCGMGHPAATVTGFAAQCAETGDAMRRANKAWLQTECVVECFALPEFDLKPKASLVMVAGKKAILVEGGAYRRADMGSTNRALLKFGDDNTAKFAGWDQSGAPATVGGPLICRDFTVWSETPTTVKVFLMDGTPFTWSGITYESDSAPIRLIVNGAEVGDITKEIKP